MATSTRPTKIFEELSRSTLNKMAEQQKIELDEYTSKGALVDAFKELAEDQAIRMLTAKLSRNDLSSICESVEVEYEEGVKNPSKAVMTKRLKEKMRAAGLEKFLNKLDGEFLQKFAEYTDVEIEDEKDLDDKTKKRSIAKHVAQVVVFEGVQSILNTYNVSFLGDMCKELGLKGTTSTKSKLIYALATHTSPKHLPSFSTAGNAREAWDEAAEESLKRKKAPQIKKGVTYQDLFQWYGVEELKEWCSENKLKVSGTKKELCNRILAYFDGDLENTLAENSKSGRSRSRSRSRSKSPHRKPVNKKKSKEDEEGSKKTKKSDEKSKKSSKSEEEEEEDSEPKSKKSKTSDKETKEKDNKKVTKSKSKEDKEEDEEEKEDKDEKKNKKGSKAGEKETSKKTKAEETDKKNKGKDETTDEKSNKKAKTTEESDNKKVTKSKSSEEKSKGKNSPKKGTKKGEDEEDDE